MEVIKEKKYHRLWRISDYMKFSLKSLEDILALQDTFKLV